MTFGGGGVLYIAQISLILLGRWLISAATHPNFSPKELILMAIGIAFAFKDIVYKLAIFI